MKPEEDTNTTEQQVEVIILIQKLAVILQNVLTIVLLVHINHQKN